jgi:hypothetical protein
MIKAGAKLSVQRILLSSLQVTELGEPWTCFPDKFNLYLKLLQNNPDEDTDPLLVRPSLTHDKMFAIKNGKHRFLANILAGRSDTPCVIEE